MNSVLQLSFDIGHSSIGWAVLETRIDKDPTLLGCGSVIFPADDCLASTRRGFRQMRRHARATRQRITRMEDAIAALGSIPRAVLKKQHAQGKGNKRGGGDGSSYPWLFAARVLAAKGDEREKHLLSWPQLWDVLRWYAHNRGYDAHLRFSSEGKAHGFADESASAASDFDSAVEDAEQAEAIEEDGESDSEKLKAGKTLSEEYGFTSNTFAETVAKILLGPPRSITLGKQGKTGKFAQSQQSFSQDDFHRILFETDDPFSEHPRHPLNYFKGIRAAFPRRVLRDGLLVGGTEWEVRRIIRAHFGHLPGCDEKLETLICGSMPEGPKDWLALRETLPRLYLSDEDRSALKELRIRRDATARTRVALKRQRREITDGKLIIPARYEGGLLFGQLGMRFHNRIISTCRFSFARIVDAIQRGDDGALAPFNVTCAGLQKIRRQRKDESDLDYARRWATSLAKVPAKKSREFLLFRWSKRLTELKVKRPALPSLTKDERMQLDEMMREHGWLTKQELKDAIRKVTDYAPSNLDQTFDATPEAAESLVVDPALKYLRTHPFASRIAALLSDKARARLRHELADGKAVALRKIERELSESDRVHFHELLSQYVTEQNAAKKKGKGSSNIEDDAGLTAKKKTKKQLTFQCLRRTSLKASVPSGRAPFHRVILKQAREEILCGENPAKPMLDDSHPSGEDKVAHGCIFETPAITRWLIDGAKTEQNTKDDFARWKERWLSHHTNKVRYDRAEAERTERGEALIRAEWQTAETQRWLAAQTNNHLVAHRMLILENLTRDLIADPLYGNGDASRITGISIEVVRDILTFSGMTRKQLTGRVLPSLRRHHEHVAAFLRESLAGTEYEHRITGDLIRKAKIADDLGWRCPYTGNPYCPYRLANGTMDEDHIIPKSRRLTNAMEALVITYKTINLRKGNQTAWQFVHDNAGKQFEGVEAPIRPIKEYEAWVENRDNKINKLQLAGETAHSGRQSWPKHLPGSGTNRKLHPDYRRRKQRKHYLLIEEFDRDKSTFTPRDLTLTSHLCKLAQQILLRILPKLPEHHITSLPGAVTKALRDAPGWRMLGCLDGAATNDVMREVPSLNHERQPENNPDGTPKMKRVPKPKGEIRELTHLHHALDASVIAVVRDVLPKNGKVWELVAKGELNADDLWAWDRTVWRSLTPEELPQGVDRDAPDCVSMFPSLKNLFTVVENMDSAGRRPLHDHLWRLFPRKLETVRPGFATQVNARLKEKRVVMQTPADYGPLDLKDTVYRIFDPTDTHPNSMRIGRWFKKLVDAGTIEMLWEPSNQDHTKVFLVARKRRGTEEGDTGDTLRDEGGVWRWIYVEKSKEAVFGIGEFHSAKLAAAKGAKLFDANFALAFLPEAKDPVRKVIVLRPYRVWGILPKLRDENGGKMPTLLRRGDSVELDVNGTPHRLRIAGVEKKADGRISCDVAYPDEIKRSHVKSPAQLGKNGKILTLNLCGSTIKETPIPSKEANPRKGARKREK